MRFRANENIGSWFGIFQARPYAFTVFETKPHLTEVRLVFPGLLEDFDGTEELTLIGVPALHQARGNSFELIGLVRPDRGGASQALLVPDSQTARIHAAYIDAVLAGGK